MEPNRISCLQLLSKWEALAIMRTPRALSPGKCQPAIQLATRSQVFLSSTQSMTAMVILKRNRDSISLMLKVRVSRKISTIETAWALATKPIKNWSSSGLVTVQAQKRATSEEEIHPRLWPQRSWDKKTTTWGNCSLRWPRPNKLYNTKWEGRPMPGNRRQRRAKDKATGKSFKRHWCILSKHTELLIMQRKQ